MPNSAEPTSNVTSKGQVTVPVEIRRALGIKPGGKVRFRRKGRQVVIEAVEEPPISSLFGLVTVEESAGVPNIDEAIDQARRQLHADIGPRRRQGR